MQTSKKNEKCEACQGFSFDSWWSPAAAQLGWQELMSLQLPDAWSTVLLLGMPWIVVSGIKYCGILICHLLISHFLHFWHSDPTLKIVWGHKCFPGAWSQITELSRDDLLNTYSLGKGWPCHGVYSLKCSLSFHWASPATDLVRGSAVLICWCYVQLCCSWAGKWNLWACFGSRPCNEDKIKGATQCSSKLWFSGGCNLSCFNSWSSSAMFKACDVTFSQSVLTSSHFGN